MYQYQDAQAQQHQQPGFYPSEQEVSGWEEFGRVYNDAAISSLSFDPVEELLWAGTEDGYVVSYLASSLQKFSGLRAHNFRKSRTETKPAASKAVVSILPFQEGIISVSSSACKLHSKGCVPLGSLQGQVQIPSHKKASVRDVAELTCAALNAPADALYHQEANASVSHVTVGSSQGASSEAGETDEDGAVVPCLYQLDLHTGLSVSRLVRLPKLAGCRSMACGAMLAVGGDDGKVRMYDPRLKSPRAEHTLQVHSGPVTSICVDPSDGLRMATLGMASHSLNPFDASAPTTLHPDNAVQVFDLRMLRNIVPLRFPTAPDPSAVAFSARDSLVVTSYSGQVNIKERPLDPSVIDTLTCYQMVNEEGSPEQLTCLSLSSSAECMALGSATGAVLKLTSNGNPEALVNLDSLPTEVPPAVAAPPPIFVHPHSDTSPGSVFVIKPEVKHVYSSGPLSSSFLHTPWVFEEVVRQRPTRKVSPALLDKMTATDFMGSIPNPGLPPNSLIHGKGKASYQVCDPRVTLADARPPQGSSSLGPSVLEQDMPRRYRPVKLKLGKRGLDTFDFGHFNSTAFAGLENTEKNSYTNAVLQLMYFTPELHAAALQQQFKSVKEMQQVGLITELGFLFHQLDLAKTTQSKVRSCQSSNFLRCFRQQPEMLALGLLVGQSGGGVKGTQMSLQRRVESFHRFLLSAFDKVSGGQFERRDKGRGQAATATAAAGGEGGEEKEEREGVASKYFGYRVRTTNTFLHSTKATTPEQVKDTHAVVVELALPESTKPSNALYFSDVLQRSLCKETTAKMWCAETSTYAPIRQRRVPRSLPRYLTVHCASGIENEALLRLFRKPNPMGGLFVPQEVVVELSEDGVKVGEKVDLLPLEDTAAAPPTDQGWHYSDGGDGKASGDDKKAPASETEGGSSSSVYRYDLASVVSDIVNTRSSTTQDSASGAPPPDGHMVLHVKPPRDYTTRSLLGRKSSGLEKERRMYGTALGEGSGSDDDKKEGQGEGKDDREDGQDGGQQPNTKAKPQANASTEEWLLFNDFYVERTVPEDAQSFLPEWKKPSILVFRLREEDGEEAGKGPGGGGAISPDVFAIPSLSKNGRAKIIPVDKLPKKGDIVAIDAEFVSLEMEQASIRRDGSRVVTKEGRLALARVSVVDGNGEVILDDYVVQSETVVDYLTRFSGITPEDLEPGSSRHSLAWLCTVYLKLRYLVDAGCVFVGHGLSKDFRIINITVPPAQVIDTVQLWSLPGQRKPSLRFLCHYLLNEHIQGETHDSIEDSSMALRLYRSHEQHREAGTLHKTMEDMYKFGRDVGWFTSSS